MTQKISIERKDGTKINLNGDGNIWLITDKSGGPLLGWIKNKTCNIGYTYGLDETTKDKYLPVNRLILKYADKLSINRIRLLVSDEEEGKYGKITRISYGYVDRNKFDYLLENRKDASIGNILKVKLLKKTDFKFEDE